MNNPFGNSAVAERPKSELAKNSANRILVAAVAFVVFSLITTNLDQSTQRWLMPLILVVVFIRAAIKIPPIAILILLFAAMNAGSWFILIAAPGTMLLARRYQRQRQQIDLTPLHVRRTVLLAVAALVAVLPFLGSSAGAWSRNEFSPTGSAAPLFEPSRTGQGALERFARWLGFGPDYVLGDEGPELIPQDVPAQPDDPFNWWILVAIVATLMLAGLAWWLWRRRSSRVTPLAGPAAATPLARLEALGEQIGRPRRDHEGAITYSKLLAERTGDTRLAEAGPLVSGQVYQSAFAMPGRVDESLRRIETSPPPPPSLGERFSARLTSLRLSPKALLIGAVGFVVLVIAGWLAATQFGDLDEDRLLLQLYAFSMR